MNATKKDFYLTQDGVDKLRAELDGLVKDERPKVAQQLKDAKEDGDLSENAAWDTAKDHQAFIEGRISEIEHILRNVVVIEAAKTATEVTIGSTVHLEIEDGKQIYTIVGSQEANPTEGKISNESPIGQALLGKTKGDEITISVPSGEMVYKVTHIE